MNTCVIIKSQNLNHGAAAVPNNNLSLLFYMWAKHEAYYLVLGFFDLEYI